MIKEFIGLFSQAAKAAGIEKLNFYTEEKFSRDLTVYQDALESLQQSQIAHMYIEGLVEGNSGSVFVENFDPALIPDYIQSIRDCAAISREPFRPYELENLESAEHFAANYLDLDETVEALCRAGQAACDCDSRIDKGVQIHLSETGRRVTLSDEQGNAASDVVMGAKLGVYLVARDGELVQPGSKGKPFAAGTLPDLKLLAEEAAQGALSRLGAGSCATGRYPVVLDAKVVGELLDAFMPAFFARNVQSRMSVLAGKLGQMLTGENISILEDPNLEGGFCTRKFDDEGVPTRAKAIVDQGRLNCWLHNRTTAQAEQVTSGGNGFKSNFHESVGTGYTNVYIPTGDKTRRELEEVMGCGLLITGVSGVFAGARPNSGDFSLISSGYRIENGKQGRAVNQITIAGNFFEMLKDVAAIGNDESWHLAPSGNVRTPSLYVTNLAISGKEKTE